MNIGSELMCLPDGDMSKDSWADFNSFFKISITIDDDESSFLDINVSFANAKSAARCFNFFLKISRAFSFSTEVV